MPASRRILVPLVAATALALGLAPPAFAGKTLDAIKQRGQLVCGVNTVRPVFFHRQPGQLDRTRRRHLPRRSPRRCSATAKKVKWVPLNASQRFTALQSGEVDILSRNTTWTLTRDASLGLDFTGVTYYDGQGFMVPKKSKITSAKQLKGATVCVQSGTTTEKNLTDYLRPTTSDEAGRVRNGGGDQQGVFLRPLPGLHDRCLRPRSMRNKEASKPDDHVILPELISKEPLGPAVRRGDDECFTIVKWVVFALIEAEEVRHHAGERRPDEDEHGSGVQRILGRRRTPASCSASTRTGRIARQAGRQLRRDLRAQRRPEVGAQAAARRQQSVEQGRPHVRAAGALMR